MKKYCTALEIWLQIIVKITRMQINSSKVFPVTVIKMAEILWPEAAFKKMDRGYYEVKWL